MLVNRREWSRSFKRGLLDSIFSGPWGPLVVCSTCRMSRDAGDKAATTAKSCEEEIGTGIGAFADHYECEAEAEDLEQSHNCCMQRVLSLQSDFQNENPFYNLSLREPGINVYFYPNCIVSIILLKWFGGRLNKVSKCPSIFHVLLTKLLV